MSDGTKDKAAFLASSNRQGFIDIWNTFIPSDLAISTVLSVDPVSAIKI